MQYANSNNAKIAMQLVTDLQTLFVKRLQQISNRPQRFDKINWQRNNGVWGGGYRFVSANNVLFNSAAINFSQVFYESEPDKILNSATALSTIIHPTHPLCPSVHMHFSFTELKNGKNYWRLMADLNPSTINQNDKLLFLKTIKSVAGIDLTEGLAQGDKYFHIPLLNRTRGVAHFYLENYLPKNIDFVDNFARKIINAYSDILTTALSQKRPADKIHQQNQIDYHTLYFLQVLTLDRGTTSGLLAHNENDLGIMGSIPRLVNRNLLVKWQKMAKYPQNKLLQNLIAVMPETKFVTIDNAIKQKLAVTIRDFFIQHPLSLENQASGFSVPDLSNHHLTV